LDVRFIECARFARGIVDGEYVSALKVSRPSAIYGATLFLWTQLVAAWAITIWGPLWLLWLPFLIHAGATQGMLLWVHEASHFTLFAERRRNDIWCDIFFAGPIGMSVAAYRAKHMTHHAHLGTDKDEDRHPYAQPIKGARALVALLAKVLTGYYGVRLALEKYIGGVKRAENYQGASPKWLAPLITIAFNLALLSLCVSVGRWYVYFIVWVYPIIAVAIALNVVRTIAEHQPEDFPQFANGSEHAMRPIVRTTIPNLFEKWLMYQANFNYHIEHHLFPTVPQHNLHKLHAKLAGGGFYKEFPECLQRSGVARFVSLMRNRKNDDFSEAVNEATERS
jgi:fatty acid desaturase